jgi:hypothetical protein
LEIAFILYIYGISLTDTFSRDNFSRDNFSGDTLPWSQILEGLEMENLGMVYFVVIWYIFSRFGILHQEKSGNPARHDKRGHCQFKASFYGENNLKPSLTTFL